MTKKTWFLKVIISDYYVVTVKKVANSQDKLATNIQQPRH